MQVAPDKMAFEQRFSDDSGVERSVSYDASKYGREIEIADCSREAEFPADRIDWLIDALQEIKKSHESRQSEAWP